MRRVALIIAALAIAVPWGWYLRWDSQTRALGSALVADVSAVKAKVIERVPPPKAPLHENGFQCLGSMLEVTPGDLSPFSQGTVNDFITGAKPTSELPPEVVARLQVLSPWAASMRGCGDSMKLAYVNGVVPWAAPRARADGAIPALIEFTALELRMLLADQQPEVALERCSATWAMVADQSHLGLTGAMNARMAVRRLAPACGEALAAAAPDVRTQVAKQWAPLRNRLAPPHEVLELERLHTSLLVFAWVADEAVRSQLPVSAAGEAGLERRLKVGQQWHAWDEAMKKLIAVADSPGPERARASEAADGPVESQVHSEKFISAYEESFLLLDLLADLAAGGSKPLPPGVTKTEAALEYVNADGQKLLIPLPK
jgi:hypothetical protein